MVDKSILYYTDNLLDHTRLGKVVRKYILKANLPITSVTLRPLDFGDNIVFDAKRSHSNMFKQILIGMKTIKTKYVILCEHDVLYHPSHFDFIPPKDNVYYYNNNVWKYRLSDKKVIGYDCQWLSQCCASRKILIEHYEAKLDAIANGKRAYGYEPGTGQSRKLTPYKTESWESEYPCVDIRHGKNWTGVNRMAQDEFRNKKNCQNWQEISVGEIPTWDEKLLLSL